MKALRALLAALCLLICPLHALEPAQVAVVYSADSELSEKTARRYAAARRIPQENLVPLHGLKQGHISRVDFELKVRLPLLREGQERGWLWPSEGAGSGKRICAMVLMPDLPLGIMESPRPKDAPKPGPFEVDQAAMDSELMVLGANLPAVGLLNNPCYEKNFSLGRDVIPVLAVCRMDGPNEESINRMIDDPPRVEQRGLSGWTVVDQGGPHKEGDVWMESIAKRAEQLGQPLFYETSRKTLATAFPLMTDTALYFGWYAHPANGPFQHKSAGDFRFAPGAVAVHIHSNSASSVKNPAFWVAALLNRGASVTAGNVFEPYLGPTLHLDVFYDRLMKGSCIAEAALMATPVLSWQSIILGDPLYRPFATTNNSTAAAQWQRMRRLHGGDIIALQRAVRLQERTEHGPALAEMLAWYCLEKKYYSLAAEFFSTACGRHKELRDRTRAVILAAEAFAADGQKMRAHAALLPWIEAGKKSPYLPALKATYEAVGGPKLEEVKGNK